MAVPARYLVTLQRFPASPPPLPKGATAAAKARRRAQMRKARIQSFLFPVNPEALNIRMGRETVDVALLRSRTVSRPGNWTPIEIDLTGVQLPHPDFIPDGTTWLNVNKSDLQDPWAVVQMLREWQTAEGDQTRLSPLRLTIADMVGFMRMVTMTQCDPQVRPGEVGAAYLDMSFKEILDLPDLKAKRVNPVTKPTSLEAHKNETLIQIVKRHFGKATKDLVDKTYALNKSVIGSDRTRRLPEGTVIKFPPK